MKPVDFDMEQMNSYLRFVARYQWYDLYNETLIGDWPIEYRHCTREDFSEADAVHVWDQISVKTSLICIDELDDVALNLTSKDFKGLSKNGLNVVISKCPGLGGDPTECKSTEQINDYLNDKFF